MNAGLLLATKDSGIPAICIDSICLLQHPKELGELMDKHANHQHGRQSAFRCGKKLLMFCQAPAQMGRQKLGLEAVCCSVVISSSLWEIIMRLLSMLRLWLDGHPCAGPLVDTWPETMQQLTGLWLFSNQLSGKNRMCPLILEYIFLVHSMTCQCMLACVAALHA